ncbi:MAG: hypothetical protein ACRDZO_27300 [Egibacteraceae bacterium]
MADLAATRTQSVLRQGRQAWADGQLVVDVIELGAQCDQVVDGERDVGAVQRAAGAERGVQDAAAVAVLVAERLGCGEDAGGEGAGIDRWVVAA